MAEYQIVVKDKDGTAIGEFKDWVNLKFSDRLNNYGACSFSVPVTSQELQTLTALRRYEVFIVRNGTIVWGGEQVIRRGGLEANSANLVEITCYSFFEMWNYRYTYVFDNPYVRYDQIDQGAILQDLVNTSQGQFGGGFGYDMGFTFDIVEETVLRDREYSRYNIMQAFINMSNLINGVDFWVTTDKQINIVAFRGLDKSEQFVLEWGTNILSCSIVEDFSSPCSDAFVLGSGFGSTQSEGYAFDLSTGENYSVRELKASETDISSENVLDDKAAGLVKKYKQPLMTLNLDQFPNSSPSFGSFGLGDSIRIKIKQGIYDINNIFRIYGFDVTIDENNTETISYLVAAI